MSSRSLLVPLQLALVAGCDVVLGIRDHELEPDAGAFAHLGPDGGVSAGLHTGGTNLGTSSVATTQGGTADAKTATQLEPMGGIGNGSTGGRSSPEPSSSGSAVSATGGAAGTGGVVPSTGAVSSSSAPGGGGSVGGLGAGGAPGSAGYIATTPTQTGGVTHTTDTALFPSLGGAAAGGSQSAGLSTTGGLSSSTPSGTSGTIGVGGTSAPGDTFADLGGSPAGGAGMGGTPLSLGGLSATTGNVASTGGSNVATGGTVAQGATSAAGGALATGGTPPNAGASGVSAIQQACSEVCAIIEGDPKLASCKFKSCTDRCTVAYDDPAVSSVAGCSEAYLLVLECGTLQPSTWTCDLGIPLPTAAPTCLSLVTALGAIPGCAETLDAVADDE